MRNQALERAIGSVAQARQLLERLVRSSESFDYPAAKEALTLLQDQIRDLRSLQAQLEAEDRGTAELDKVVQLDAGVWCGRGERGRL